MILLAPLKNPSHEVIELIVPGTDDGATDNELMSTLQQAVEIASVQEDQKSTTELREFDVSSLSQFMHGIHGSLEKTTTCSNIANEARLLLDCDRVAVAVRKRGSFQISSISGQPSVNRRSNTVRLLERLAKLILKTEQEFWYPTQQQLPRQLQSLIDDYLAISVTRSLVIMPVLEKAEQLIDDPESSGGAGNRVIGGLIFEHCTQQWDQRLVSGKLSFVHEHASMALRNAVQHNDLFLYPLWKWLAKSRVLTAPRVLPRTLSVLLAATVLTLFLVFWQVPFYVAADGVFVPRQRAWVYAGQSGDIDTVLVEHGMSVESGQVLASLNNRQLQLSIAETRGRIDILRQRQRDIEKKKFAITGDQSSRQQLDENLNSVKAEIKALNDKLALQQQLMQRTQLRSPIGGQVLTWDVEQKLLGRTVRPEQQLIEIANVDGPWILELDVADRKTGHLLRGIERAKGRRLNVKFTLAAQPDQVYDGYVTKVGSAIHFTEDHDQMVRVEVAADQQLPRSKPSRSGVTAKIYTGNKTSIGYLWLHEIPEAFHRYVSFYFAR